MLKIDFNEFFFHRVIFGFSAGRCIHTEGGVEVSREYFYEWQWKFNNVVTMRKVPWHRCWVYDKLVKEYINGQN